LLKKTNLMAHIFDGNSGHLFEVLVSDVDEDTVDAFVLSVNHQLGEHHDVLGVAGAVGDLG
jgi:hypothetical protein